MQHRLDNFFEIMDHNIQSEYLTLDFIKTSIRGLVMLLQMAEMEHFDFFSVFEKTIRLFKLLSEELKRQVDTRDQEFIVGLLAQCVPKAEFQHTI